MDAHSKPHGRHARKEVTSHLDTQIIRAPAPTSQPKKRKILVFPSLCKRSSGLHSQDTKCGCVSSDLVQLASPSPMDRVLMKQEQADKAYGKTALITCAKDDS